MAPSYGDAVAAVGLASSIVAFVDFAQKVVARLNEFSNDLKDGTNALFTIKTQLPVIIDGLRRIKERADSGKLDDGAKVALLPVVSACQTQVQLLNGILDNILPAADASKWERRRKAFQSLAADGRVKKASEILSQHLQTLTFYHSIGDPVPPQPVVKKVFWLVPFDRNGNFVGRESVFDEIDEAFKVSEGTQPKAALYGLGGIGKSQIALEYCFRKRQHQPECSLFWVNGATVARFEESFQLMAKEFGVNDSDGDDAKKDNLVSAKFWLETVFVEPWVMIIDNVDDEKAFFREKCHNDKTPSQVLPHCSHGQLLFTSRTRNVACDLASPEIPISVDFMSTEEGLHLLRKRLGSDPPESQLIELLTELGHIPLAITQAISFILKRRKTVKQYLELYHQGEKSMSRLLSHEFLAHGRQEQTMESVARTWQISFEWIQKNDPNAAEILCLMGFYQHHGVPEQLLRREDVDDFQFEESIATLQSFSLLEMEKERKSYSTHRLIQVTTKLWLEQKELAQVEEWPLRALNQITRLFPNDDYPFEDKYWVKGQSLLPHADILLERCFTVHKRESDLQKATLLIRTGDYIYWAESDYEDVMRRWKRSFELRQKHLGSDHSDTWSSMSRYFQFLISPVTVYPPDMDSNKVAEMGHALLSHYREVCGPRHMTTISSMGEMALFLNKEGKFDESESMQREALKISEEVLGHEDDITVICMKGLATTLQDTGRFEEAVEIWRECIRIDSERFGPAHKWVLDGKNNLGFCLAEAGRLDEAISLNKEVMTLNEGIFGRDHPNTLITARNLAITLHNDRRYGEARDILDHILNMVKSSQRVYRNEQTAQAILELRSKFENEMKINSNLSVSSAADGD